MNIQLTFQSQDYEFIVEAIKLRTTAILEAMSMQYDSQVLAANQKAAEEFGNWTVRQKDGKYYAEVKTDNEPKTEEIKEKNVTIKRKSKAAPYGYKKDGTPKKRPGRQAGI